MIKIRLLLIAFVSFITVGVRAQAFARIYGKHLVVSYYPNGKIKEKGHQGYYENKGVSTGMYTGTWLRYGINGKLMESVYYHNAIPSKAYILKTHYHPNGKVSSVERFNNYELYESTIDTIGIWTYYDRNGKLIKKIAH